MANYVTCVVNGHVINIYYVTSSAKKNIWISPYNLCQLDSTLNINYLLSKANFHREMLRCQVFQSRIYTEFVSENYFPYILREMNLPALEEILSTVIIPTIRVKEKEVTKFDTIIMCDPVTKKEEICVLVRVITRLMGYSRRSYPKDLIGECNIRRITGTNAIYMTHVGFRRMLQRTHKVFPRFIINIIEDMFTNVERKLIKVTC